MQPKYQNTIGTALFTTINQGIKWNNYTSARSCECGSRRSILRLEEKIAIVKSDKDKSLNKRSELNVKTNINLNCAISKGHKLNFHF